MRSSCMVLFTQILVNSWSLPAILGYKRLRAGFSKGKTLKLQFIHPASCCHFHRVHEAPCFFSDQIVKSSMSCRSSLRACFGRVKVRLFVRATPSKIPKWASCRLYKNSGLDEMRLMG